MVPNQTVSRTYEQFRNYIQKLWEDSKSENIYNFQLRIGFNPWMEEPTSDHYKAAERAIETVRFYTIISNTLVKKFLIMQN